MGAAPRSEEPITIELNPSETRLYDRLRSRVRSARPGDASGLRDMLLLLPDFTVLLTRLLREPRIPLGSKLLALAGLGYVISPIDVLPTLLFGPLGLVDDLLVVTAALSRLLNHAHPDVIRHHWPGQGDALEAIQRASRWSARFVGGRVRGAFKGRLRTG